MNSYNLLMYADKAYLPFRDKTVTDLKQTHIFNSYILKTRSDLIDTEFYFKNKTILDCPRGGGCWAWKPYFILEALNMLPDNEILFYIDSMDYIVNPYHLKKLCDKKFETYDYLFFTGNNPQKEYTRYDCFYLMDCLQEKYFNQIQMEAGIMFLKNTSFIKEFIKEWLHYCLNYQIISFDAKNIYGDNDPIFKEHRDDQSVLTNLICKYNIPTIPITDEIRNSQIHCNYYTL